MKKPIFIFCPPDIDVDAFVVDELSGIVERANKAHINHSNTIELPNAREVIKATLRFKHPSITRCEYGYYGDDAFMERVYMVAEPIYVAASIDVTFMRIQQRASTVMVMNRESKWLGLYNRMMEKKEKFFLIDQNLKKSHWVIHRDPPKKKRKQQYVSGQKALFNIQTQGELAYPD